VVEVNDEHTHARTLLSTQAVVEVNDEHTHACTLLSTQAVVEVTDEHTHACTLLSTQAVVEVTDEHTHACTLLSTQAVVEVIDNVLEPNNEAGWQAFEEVRELTIRLYRTRSLMHAGRSQHKNEHVIIVANFQNQFIYAREIDFVHYWCHFYQATPNVFAD
jgi:hypothetical protein